MSKAEDKVKRLAKLKSNCTCANCGKHNKFGFSTVCIKFHTFVCNECKTSHQAISHRCKSLTMSSWTHEEVKELEAKGNDHARQTWLQHAPPCGQGGRPKPGSELGVYKRFVVECYEHRRYYGEASDAKPVVVAAVAAPVVAAAAQKKHHKKHRAPAAKPASAPEVDLLDFGSDPVPSAAPSSVSSSSDLMQADFGNFSSAPAPADFGNFSSAPAPADFGNFSSAPAPTPPTDLFQPNFNAAPTPAPAAPLSFDPFSSSSSAMNGTQSINSHMSAAAKQDPFGDFAGFTTSTAPAPATMAPAAKKPIMGGHENASKISMMGGASLAQPFSSNNPQMAMTPQQMQQQLLRMQQQQAQMMQTMNFGNGFGNSNGHQQRF